MQLINIHFVLSPSPPGGNMQMIFEEDLYFILENGLRLELQKRRVESVKACKKSSGI